MQQTKKVVQNLISVQNNNLNPKFSGININENV